MNLKKRGKIWYVRYRLNGHDIAESLHTTSRREAERILAVKRAELVRGQIKAAPRDVMFLDFAQEYIDSCVEYNRAIKDKVRHVNWFLAEWGNLPMAQITPDMVFAAQRKLVQQSSQATCNRYFHTIKNLFRVAMDRELISSNPCQRVKLFPDKSVKIEILSRDEADLLVSACVSHVKPIVVCGLNTGMRIGEILNLRWDRVNLSRRHLRVVETKTGEDREIPINKTLYAVLSEIERDSEFVFTFKGQPIKSIKTAFASALRRAGIEKPIRIHDMRHTFVSWMLERGADRKLLMEITGHKTTKIFDRYSHPTSSAKMFTIGLLDRDGDKMGTTAQDEHIDDEVRTSVKLLKFKG